MCIKYLSSLISYHCRRVRICFFLGQWMDDDDGWQISKNVCLGNHVHILLAYRKRSAHLGCASLNSHHTKMCEQTAESKAKRMVLPHVFLCHSFFLVGRMHGSLYTLTKSASHYVILHRYHCQSTHCYL